MRSRRSILLIGGIVVMSVVLTRAHTQERTKLDSHRTLGAAKSFRNLTLIPVYDSGARATDDYATLDEGLTTKTVRVQESKDGGEVNSLFISSNSQKPLYLMAGEVVLGGQQDRCIGHDTIIPSGKKRVQVTVFCVEHGRWTGRKDFDGSAKMVASAGIRGDAQAGAFYAKAQAGPAQVAQANTYPAAQGVRVTGTPTSGLHVERVARAPHQIEVNSAAETIAGHETRRVAGRVGNMDSHGVTTIDVGKAQQKVWDSVEAKNAKFRATSETGTYHKILNMEAADARNSVKPYLDAFKGGFGSDPKLVGVVAAINGKVATADIFGDSTLFRKLWPKLLRSYAADAAENSNPSSKSSHATAEQAKAFIVQAGDAASKAENGSDVSSTIRLESKSAVAYRLMARPPRPTVKTQMWVLHENVLKK